jgi:hypothetical protein
MAFTISFPKKPILVPFFILLAIVLAPFALFFSLIRLPFSKRRIVKLNELIPADWIPRKKYIYLNYDDDFALAKFAEEELIPKYGNHIIFDKWSPDESKWSENEPDTYRRVTTILQDIAGDFDGDYHLLIAVLSPENRSLSETSDNIMYLLESKEGYVHLNGKDIRLEDAEKQIIDKIESSLGQWQLP